MKSYEDTNSGSATGTPSLVAKASALEKPGTWVRVLASVIFFSFVPLRPFLCAALAKGWNVQFRQRFEYMNNNVDSKRHIIIRTAIFYNEINTGQIMKKILSNSMSRKSPHEEKATEWI